MPYHPNYHNIYNLVPQHNCTVKFCSSSLSVRCRTTSVHITKQHVYKVWKL